MQKIKKIFKALVAVIRKPWLIYAVLEVKDEWKEYVIKKFGTNPELVTISFSSLCGEKPEAVEPYAFLEGGSLPTDISLLKTLAKNIPACRFFEIGTWRGESVANVAAVSKECVTINLSGEDIIAMGGSREYADAHFFFSRGLPNVTHIEQSSKQLDFESFDKKFDLVFIDGDHHYDMIKHDTKKVIDHLVHSDSIIVWHDYALNPENVRYEVLAGILESIPADKHKFLYHVSNTMCAVYYPHELAGVKMKYPHTPSGFFRVDLQWKNL